MIKYLTLLLLLITPVHASITGNWVMNGYLVDSSLDEGITPLIDIQGNVQITNSQLSFTSNRGNFSTPVSFVQSGDRYRHEVTNRFPDQDPTDGVSPGLSDIYRIEIRQLDDDTMIMLETSARFAENNGMDQVGGWVKNGIDSSSALGVVLTRADRQIPDPIGWDSSYTVQAVSTQIRNDQAGFLGEQHTGNAMLTKAGSGYSFVSTQAEMLRFPLSVSAGLDALHFSTSDNAVYWLGEDSAFNNYNISQALGQRVISAGDGRLFVLFSDIRIFEARPKAGNPMTANSRSLSDAFFSVSLLSDRSVGRMSGLRGSVTVLRGGQILVASEGETVHQGDTVRTGDGASVQIDYRDQTIHRLGANSRVKIEAFRYHSDVGDDLFSTLIRKGVLWMKSGSMDKSKYQIRSKSASTGLRGTSFTMSYEEVGGVGTSVVDVEEGSVDMTRLSNSSVLTLSAGEQGSATKPMETATFTLLFPTSTGGGLSVQGETITQFPHVVSVPLGSELTLHAIRDSGFIFAGWSGDLSSPDACHTFHVDGDTTVSGSFNTYNVNDTAYTDGWVGSGYSLIQRLPGEDANGDGVSNAMAFAFGFPPAGQLSPSERQSLPRAAASLSGGRSALQMQLPEVTPPGVIYTAEVTSELDTPEHDWTEIARKEGNDNWDGTEASRISSASPVDDAVTTTIEFPATFTTKPYGFMRIRVELRD